MKLENLIQKNTLRDLHDKEKYSNNCNSCILIKLVNCNETENETFFITNKFDGKNDMIKLK